MKIILIEPEEKVRNFYSASLSGELGAEVLERDDASSAIGMLELLDDIDMVICHEKVKTEKTADKLIQWIQSNNNETQLLILCDDFQCQGPNIHCTSINISAKALASKIHDIFNSMKVHEPNKVIKKKKFTPFSINLFQFFHRMPSDIFIPIEKDDGKKMIQRYKEGDNFELSEIKSYKNKGLSHFFVNQKDKEKTLNFINSRLSDIMSSPHGKDKTKEQIQNYVLKQLSEVKFNPSILKLAQTSANEMIHRFEESVDFGEELRKILKNQMGFKYRKAYTMILLSQGMLKELTWVEKRHYEYFALASFLQDSTLREDEDLQILLESELNSKVFDTKKHSAILNHAKDTSNMLKKIDKIPSEVTKMVQQHHGSFSGVGFPNTLASQITPLSRLLIACDEFSTRLISHMRQDINISQIMRDISNKFSDGSLDEYLEKLAKNFSD